MTRLTDEHIKQIADAMNMGLGVADELREEGYAMEAVAEGMMEAAFSALAHDRDLFLTVLSRFRQSYKL